jgi:hypothetical protein
MDTYTRYIDLLLEAFINSDKSREIANKKIELLEEVVDGLHSDYQSILFVGFSPWCLGFADKKIYISKVSDEVTDFLADNKVNFEKIDINDSTKSKIADITVAADEFFTFADDDQGQRNLVDTLGKLTKKLLITTLRDYKNQDYRDREFSQPLILRGTNNKIYLEHYDYNPKDKNSFTSTTYIIGQDSGDTYGPIPRRNMYFKQLAKFSMDAGASNFFVHKNLMYKSIIKRNYEHIITIRF